MRCEIVPCRACPYDWQVEVINLDDGGNGEGETYAATFSGPEAKARAEEYAACSRQALSQDSFVQPESGVTSAVQERSTRPDCRLPAGCVAPRYTAQAGGIALETKKDVVKRLGWSPDEADAAVMGLIGMPVMDGQVRQIEVVVSQG